MATPRRRSPVPRSVAALVLAALSLVLLASRPAAAQNKVFSYYYYSDNGVKHWETPGNQITHLIWSFANILQDGTVTLQGPTHTPAGREAERRATQVTFGHMDNTKCNCPGSCLKGELWQLHLLKQKYPHLKTIMSVGGWVWSDNFSQALSTPQGRSRALQTSIDLMERFGFDGLDFDWEFCETSKDKNEFKFWSFRPDDTANLARFMEEARAEFTKRRKDWSLSFAASGYQFYGKQADWQSLGRTLDHLLVMAYEYQHGHDRTWPGGALLPADGDSSWERKNTASSGVASFVAMGVPKEKVVMGIPLYGNGWSRFSSAAGSRDNLQGFGLSIKGNANVKPLNPTAYNVLMADFTAQGSKYKQQSDARRHTNVWWNETNVWFLDSPQTVAAKAKWVADNGYGGVMLWNSNQDINTPELSLINGINKVYPIDTKLGARSNEYCLGDKPAYCNLACGYKPSNTTVAKANPGEIAGAGPLGIKPRDAKDTVSFGKINAGERLHAGMGLASIALVAVAAVLL